MTRTLGAAMLLALSALLALTGCVGTVPSADPTPSEVAQPSEPATPTPVASAPSTVAVDPAAYAAREIGTGAVFRSPSGNLRCGIVTFDVEYLWGCRIEEKDWEFPSGDSSDYCFEAQVPCGWGVEAIGAGETHPRKRGDVAFESEYREDALVLEYGTSITLADVTCESAESAVTCTHGTSGHGFTISQTRNDVW